MVEISPGTTLGRNDDQKMTFPGDSSPSALNDSSGGCFTGVVLLRLRGSLDFARDDGTRSGIFTRKDDLSRR